MINKGQSLYQLLNKIKKHNLNVNIIMLESWPSGRRRTLGKRVEVQISHGFESHTLREIYFVGSLTPPGQKCSNGSEPAREENVTYCFSKKI